MSFDVIAGLEICPSIRCPKAWAISLRTIMSWEDQREIVASSNSRRSKRLKLVRTIIETGEQWILDVFPVAAQTPDVGIRRIFLA